VPKPVAKTITENLLIPTIGIGAGVETDGQVLVWHDMLGLQTEIKPKFIKQYAVSKDFILQALHAYADDVHHAYFPTEAESY
jgi:3-methyl-2-oxobutanoate hydroxymethyltransferase